MYSEMHEEARIYVSFLSYYVLLRPTSGVWQKGLPSHSHLIPYNVYREKMRAMKKSIKESAE